MSCAAASLCSGDAATSSDGKTASGLPEAWWFRPDGRKLTQQDWQREPRVLGVFLNGLELGERNLDGSPVTGASFVVVVNGGREPVLFKLPPVRFGRGWLLELTTSDPAAPAERLAAGGRLELEALSLCVLRRDG